MRHQLAWRFLLGQETYMWFGKRDEIYQLDGFMDQLREVVNDVVKGQLSDAVTSTTKALDRVRTVTQLNEEIESLKLERGRLREEGERHAREVEHKVGLERMRQDHEIANAKRETEITVREENLSADRERFTEQIDFHEKRFTEEVSYLRNMVTKVLEHMPSATIELTNSVGETKKKTKSK